MLGDSSFVSTAFVVMFGAGFLAAGLLATFLAIDAVDRIGRLFGAPMVCSDSSQKSA